MFPVFYSVSDGRELETAVCSHELRVTVGQDVSLWWNGDIDAEKRLRPFKFRNSRNERT